MGDGLGLESPPPPPLLILEARRTVTERSGGSRELDSRDAACLLLCVQGSVEISSAGKRIQLSARETLLVDAGSAEPVCVTHEAETDYYVVRFRQEGCAEGPATDCLVIPSCTVARGSARLTRLLHMCVERSRGEGTSPLLLYHLLVLALCEVARASHDGAREAGGDGCFQSVASHVDAYIAAHYHEAIGTPAIARQLRYNPYYLERAYRQERHMSIREAIHKRRIREACAQLRLSGTRGVAEIAALCGYNDTGYFRRDFKRATHMTPHSYRVVGGTEAFVLPWEPV